MSKKSLNRKKVLWVDLEMTGLDPEQDRILELATIVTDWELNEVESLELVLKQDPIWLQAIFAKSIFWTKFSNTAQHLFLQNATGIDNLEQFENDLIVFVQSTFDIKEPNSDIILAGNTIRCDRQFIDKYLPRFAQYLHYRMLDVSSFKVYFDGRYKKVYLKQENHRALEDIRGSIEELKYFEKFINVKS